MYRISHTIVGIVLVALMFQSAACTRGGIEFDDPWIPAAPSNVMALAGYLEIRNGTGEALKITGAHSPDFKKVEFHRTEHQGDLARMIESAILEIPPRSSLALEPGGHHLMLIGATRPLDEGQTATVILILADGRELPVEFSVRRVEFRL